MNDDRVDSVKDWFLEHTRDGDTLYWGQDHVVVADVATGWVDVVVPALCEALGWNWWLTISSPDAENAGGDDLLLDYDVRLWRTWDDEEFSYREEHCVLTGPREELSDEQRAIFGEDEPFGLGGWRNDTLSRALAAWVYQHTGRTVSFVFDRSISSDLVAHLQEQLEAHANGSLRTYEIAPGIVASDQVLDTLLALDAEDAAALSAAIVDTLRPLVDSLGPHAVLSDED